MKILLEIRGGAGGQDALNFAEELFVVYLKFLSKMGAEFEIISEDKTKVIMANVKGKVLAVLKNEVGVHKIQRVPITERHGRVQTSTATVAVLVNEDSSLVINENDLEYQAYRASGPGGQHRNKTETAIRVIHKPTGTVATCDGRSQYANKISALEVLKIRLQVADADKKRQQENSSRSQQVKGGNRSDSKRLYSFSRNLIVDSESGKSCDLNSFFKKALLEKLM